MADTTVTLTTLTAGTVSADLITTAEGGTAVTTTNVAVVDCGGHTGNVIFTFYAASASSIVVQAGDNPPALRAGLGANASQTIPAGDVLIMCVEAGRFAQDNGTIRLTVGANTVVVGAYKVPNTI
jgi:predicted RNA methylase